MENELTLREMCSKFDVKRRAVQGYESAGLLLPSGKNKYGHLLYDEEAQKRVERIKFYQDIGFRLRDINALIDAPPSLVKAALGRQIEHLHAERRQMQHLIEKAQAMIAEL